MGSAKVFFLLSGVEKYGVRRGTLSFASGLRAVGIETEFAAITDGPVAQEISAQGHRIDILGEQPIPGLSGGLWDGVAQLALQAARGWKMSLKLRTLLQSSRPSAVYFRLPNLVVPVGLATQRTRIPAYWHIPNAISSRYPLKLNRRLYWSVLDRSNIVPVANSAFTATTLDRGKDRIKVLHVGTDERVFNPNRIASPVTRDELSIPPHAAVFGMFARIVENKGQLQFLRALLELPEDLTRDVHLLLVGGPLDTPYAEELRQLVTTRNRQLRVHLLDSVPDPERYYAVVDVAVSARLDAEPYGQSVVEAMMMGKPVLAHALGGPSETVIDGATGWLTPSSNTRDFAKGITRALAARSEWLSLGQQARAHALGHFSLNAQVARFLMIAPHLA